jgi:hypothetical protein
MNSREKGKRGERQWRDELRAQGFAARRGQQFSGSPDSPDVVCDDLPWIHFEVKAVERLNIEDAMEQARRDCGRGAPAGQKIPIVAHRRNFRAWLVTMTAEVFFRFLRGDFLTGANRENGGVATSPLPSPPEAERERVDGSHSVDGKNFGHEVAEGRPPIVPTNNKNQREERIE